MRVGYARLLLLHPISPLLFRELLLVLELRRWSCWTSGMHIAAYKQFRSAFTIWGAASCIDDQIAVVMIHLEVFGSPFSHVIDLFFLCKTLINLTCLRVNGWWVRNRDENVLFSRLTPFAWEFVGGGCTRSASLYMWSTWKILIASWKSGVMLCSIFSTVFPPKVSRIFEILFLLYRVFQK